MPLDNDYKNININISMRIRRLFLNLSKVNIVSSVFSCITKTLLYHYTNILMFRNISPTHTSGIGESCT